MIKWVDDWQNDETDPQDGQEPITIWWEDMRRREVRLLVKNSYERGVKYQQCKNAKYKEALLRLLTHEPRYPTAAHIQDIIFAKNIINEDAE